MQIREISDRPELVEMFDVWYWRYCVKLVDGRHAHLWVDAFPDELQEVSFDLGGEDKVPHRCYPHTPLEVHTSEA